VRYFSINTNANISLSFSKERNRNLLEIAADDCKYINELSESISFYPLILNFCIMVYFYSLEKDENEGGKQTAKIFFCYFDNLFIRGHIIIIIKILYVFVESENKK
jgi:hypothetical protein